MRSPRLRAQAQRSASRFRRAPTRSWSPGTGPRPTTQSPSPTRFSPPPEIRRGPGDAGASPLVTGDAANNQQLKATWLLTASKAFLALTCEAFTCAYQTAPASDNGSDVF